MQRLLDYLKQKQDENIELALKFEYSLYYGWIVKVIRKGYDMPIVEVNDNSLDNAIEITYSELNNLVEYNKQR